jgi:large subunit ribosomal protein L31
MKEGIHPNYRPVIFRDVSNGASFLIGSTIATQEKATWEDGKEYPLVSMEISSASHPFYTGQARVVDTQGRIEKFKKRFGQEPTKGSTVRKSRPKPSAAKPENPESE